MPDYEKSFKEAFGDALKKLPHGYYAMDVVFGTPTGESTLPRVLSYRIIPKQPPPKNSAATQTNFPLLKKQTACSTSTGGTESGGRNVQGNTENVGVNTDGRNVGDNTEGPSVGENREGRNVGENMEGPNVGENTEGPNVGVNTEGQTVDKRDDTEGQNVGVNTEGLNVGVNTDGLNVGVNTIEQNVDKKDDTEGQNVKSDEVLSRGDRAGDVCRGTE